MNKYKKLSKYKAKKTVIDGIKFDSMKEAKRYGELKMLQRLGEISGLKCQPTFRLEVDDSLICKYIADFSYYLGGDGLERFIVEDVKGMKKGAAWQIFRIKAKLMKAIYRIDVVVV